MAQLDSASDSDSEGRWFESSRAYQKKRSKKIFGEKLRDFKTSEPLDSENPRASKFRFFPTSYSLRQDLNLRHNSFK